jgi:hypothetical protein
MAGFLGCKIRELKLISRRQQEKVSEIALLTW